MPFLESLSLSASVGSLQQNLFCPSGLAFDVPRPSSLKQASATASSAISPIQHPHWPSRHFIQIAVSPSAPVCVIRYLSAFGGLLGCFPVCRSPDFQSLISCLRPSWFFGCCAGLFPQGFCYSVLCRCSCQSRAFLVSLCLCGAFPHRGFCYSVHCWCSCQFRAFLVGLAFFPQGFLL